MPKNLIYKYDEKNTRVRTLAATVSSGTPLLDPADSRPAVALTNSGDSVKTVTTDDIPIGGGVTSLTYPNGGVGLIGKETTLAYDGTWEHAVTGVLTNTANGVIVYFVAATGLLTLTVGTAPVNATYGRIDYPTDYLKRAAIAPVRIGD